MAFGGSTGVGDSLQKYYEANKLSRNDLDVIKSIKERLGNVIRNDLYPGSKLLLFGSSLSGFGAEDCDADLCLWFPSQVATYGSSRDMDRNEEVLNEIQRHLEGMAEGGSSPISYRNTKVEVIQANVPVLKCPMSRRRGVTVDVTVNMIGGVVTTYLQTLFSDYDSRVAPLCLIVKQWAKKQGICDPSQGTMNSLSWALLVINFLQVSERILPAYRPIKREKVKTFKGRNKKGIWGAFHLRNQDVIDNIENMEKQMLSKATGKHDTAEPTFVFVQNQPVKRKKNWKSMFDLLQSFCSYYSSFPFEKSIVVVRTGAVAGRRYKKMQKEEREGIIVIQEPATGANVAKTVTSVGFNKIKEKLAQARLLLSTCGHDGQGWERIFCQ